jgi:hypothetical protein
VSIEGRNYPPTDIEFEEEALRSALRDGLVRSRGDVVASVNAREAPLAGASFD